MKDRIFEAVLVAGALALSGCTPAEIKYVNGGIAVAGEVCQGIVIASGDPAMAPICSSVAEALQAFTELVGEQSSAKVAALAPAPITNKMLYQRIVQNRLKAGQK